MKLTSSEKKILSLLIYPETFNQLLEETGLQKGLLRDDLMNLVSHRYVEVYEKDGSRPVSPFYDSDHLELFAFKATKSGLNAIQGYAV
ncbi:MAG: hypothetical protein WEC12_07315 [Balneolaceae bacterium]